MNKVNSLSLSSLILMTMSCFGTEPSKQDNITQGTPLSFLDMKQEECKACGIEKLTVDEKAALQSWIQKYGESKGEKEEGLTLKIQAVKDGGKVLELEDGRILSIPSSSRKTVVLWNTGDMVRVEPSKKKNSFDLVHVSSGKKVKAKVKKDETSKDSK